MALILPLDLETMILRYAGCHYPFASMRAAGDRTLRNWFNLNIVLREFFIQPWTPTACNVLRWVPLREKEERYVWYYDPLTRLTPLSKREVSHLRQIHGLIPIFPGSSHTPTSRVRFNPNKHTNTRYFR